VKQKPEDSIRIFSAGLLLNQIDILMAEIDGVRAAKDIEAVHKTRVSSRRIRAILDVFHDCLPAKRSGIWLQNVRRLTGALGAARDTDVQTVTVKTLMKDLPDPKMQAGFHRLLLRLNQRRQNLQTRVISRLDDFVSSGVVEEMRAECAGLISRNQTVYLYTPSLYRKSFESIRSNFDVFKSYEERILDPTNIDDLHAMRVAGKNLRYTMECFSSIYSHELKLHMGIMKNAQETLGYIHDCDVWMTELPLFLEKERTLTIAYFGRDRYAGRFEPGINYLLENRAQYRNELYNTFLQNWNRWKNEGVWDTLFQLLQVPFFEEKEIMPLSLIKQVNNGGE